MIRRATYALLCAFLVLASFRVQAQGRAVQGEGNVVKQDITLPALRGIDMMLAGEVILTQGNTQKITVEAQQNIIDLLKRDVKEGVWQIGFDRNVNEYKSVKIHMTLPTLEDVGLAGSGSIASTNKFSNLNDLDIEVSGSGSVTLDIAAKSTDVELAGSGRITLKGSTANLDVEIAGSGDVNAQDLKADECDVEISGSGDAHVNAAKKLDASIAGSGDIQYTGSASVSSSIVGSGTIKKAN